MNHGIVRQFRFAFSAIILAAILIRGLIPAGFMPGTAGDGLARFILCAPTGVSTFVADAAHAERVKEIYAGHILQVGKTGKTDSKPHNPCPFAPAFASGLIVSAIIIAAQIFPYESFTLPASRLFISLPQKSYNAQGPPAITA